MARLMIPDHLRTRLLANGAHSASGQDTDPSPVVKLFTPDANATWFLTELDPDRPDLAFGLCDLGFGCPELGSVCLNELASLRGPLGLPVEIDQHYVETRPLSVLSALARTLGHL